MRRRRSEQLTFLFPTTKHAPPCAQLRWYSDRNQKLSPDRTRNETISDRQSRFQWARLHHVRPHHRFTHDPLSWNRRRDAETVSARARQLPIFSRLAVLEERAAEQKINRQARQSHSQTMIHSLTPPAAEFSTGEGSSEESKVSTNRTATLSPVALHQCRAEYEQALRHGTTPNDARRKEAEYAVLLRQALECLEERGTGAVRARHDDESLSAGTVAFLGCELLQGAQVLLHSLAIEDAAQVQAQPAIADVPVADAAGEAAGVSNVHLCRLWLAVVPRVVAAITDILSNSSTCQGAESDDEDWRGVASACIQGAFCVTHPIVLRSLPLVKSTQPSTLATIAAIQLCREPLSEASCSRAAVRLLQCALVTIRRGLLLPSAGSLEGGPSAIASADDGDAQSKIHSSEVPLSPPLLLLAWTTLRRVQRSTKSESGGQDSKASGRLERAKKKPSPQTRKKQSSSSHTAESNEELSLGVIVDGFLLATTQTLKMLTAAVKHQHDRNEGAPAAARLSLKMSDGGAESCDRGQPASPLPTNRRRMPFLGPACRSTSLYGGLDSSSSSCRMASEPLPMGDVACLLRSLALCVSLRPVSCHPVSAATRFGRLSTVVDLLAYVPNYSISVELFAAWWAAGREFVWGDGLPTGAVSAEGYGNSTTPHSWRVDDGVTAAARKRDRRILTHKLTLIASRLATEHAPPSALLSLLECITSTADTGDVPAADGGRTAFSGSDERGAASDDRNAQRRKDDDETQMWRIDADIKRLRGICAQKIFRALPPSHLWLRSECSDQSTSFTTPVNILLAQVVVCDVAVPITWWRDAVREWLLRPASGATTQPAVVTTSKKHSRKKAATGSSSAAPAAANHCASTATGALLAVLRTQCRTPQQQQSRAVRNGEEKRAVAMSEQDWIRLRALVASTASSPSTSSGGSADSQSSPLSEDEWKNIVDLLTASSLLTSDVERRQVERRMRDLAEEKCSAAS